jgi:hypothetical protein
MADMGIGCAFLSEVKISDNKYAKRMEGYEVIISRGKNKQQGGVALLWKDEHPMFEIENANARVCNLITIQLKQEIKGSTSWRSTSGPDARRGGRPQECLGPVSRKLYTACHWGFEH